MSCGGELIVPKTPGSSAATLATAATTHNPTTRIAIRNIRRDEIKDLQEFEKEKMVSEDEKKRGEDEIQKITDRFIEDINAIGERKEKEILEV